MELLPGARFRIPVQNQAGAWGSGLVGRDPPVSVSGFPDHPGGPQFDLGPGPWDFSPGTAGALRKSALSTRGGITEKKFLFFPKRLL